jgi:hypothetical protein
MSNELVVNKHIPSEHEMMVYHTMAEQAVSSKMYNGIGDKSGVMMIMLAARELGIPAMQALNGGLNIIQGKVEISARMMNALIRKAGHQIIVKEISDTACTLQGRRCDTGETQLSSFSVAEAQRAGLVKAGGGWTKWPRDMCYARALSRLARQLFSDVIGIGYVEGEIKAGEIESVSNIEIPEEQILDDKQELEKLLSQFSEEEKPFLLEYVKVVSKHFSWSESECVQKFLKEKNLKVKFQEWKAKQQWSEPLTP